MKKIVIILSLLLSVNANSQYSNYYNVDVNADVNANINKNVNVTGTVHQYKTIRTIDYGSLKLANAQIERNRLEQQKFENERQKRIAIEISNNPLKAYEYGNWFTISSKDKKKWPKGTLKKTKKNIGFKQFRVDYIVPSGLLFNMLNAYHLQSVSTEGITTDILIFLPFYNKDEIEIDIEKQFEEITVGKELEEPDDQNKLRKILFHKKDLNRATVYGAKGYVSTVAWEDKFEYGITDNYRFLNENFGNGFSLLVKVRYYGDKDVIDFEKLEGRKYYLKPLIDKIISTAKVNDLKY